jgi:hypothetical protein
MMMLRSLPRLPRVSRLALFGFLTALLLTLGLTLFPALARHTFAATRAPLTCFDQPDVAHCALKDPIAAHCADDSVLTESVPITDLAGTVLGRLDRRHSLHCHTWWGRLLDFRHLPATTLYLQVGQTSYTLHFPDVGFSDMVFDLSNTHAPLIQGSLPTLAGKPDLEFTASLPADPPESIPPAPSPKPTPAPSPTPPPPPTPTPPLHPKFGGK